MDRRISRYKRIQDIKILVVGDIMLDKYVITDVNRICPEAPIVIADVVDEYHSLGGCGNVVRNIIELGAKVHCLSSIGDDFGGKIITQELTNIGARSLLFNGSKQTTIKERIIARQRSVQILRIDREEIKPINAKTSIDILTKMCKDDYDMIIISDYAKGMITDQLMNFLKTTQRANIIVDPKPINGPLYNGVFMITPNDKEWNQMLLSSAYNFKDIKYILNTKGKDGMKLIDNQNEDVWNIESEKVPVYNVSGAGDVVVAMMAICLSQGLNILDSSYIANKCAGYAVTQPQTCVIPKDKYTEIYNDYFKGK